MNTNICIKYDHDDACGLNVSFASIELVQVLFFEPPVNRDFKFWLKIDWKKAI